ncbi:uncharacterized protein LOC112053777 [Bicyclus anynana]|uniref:Uncharacterized protein LOC112053777 n=1 Tax=Bicyclus anynana TaxID=110368 RepID=A0ABM3LV43_BICAN|nr:uncharacterized protein LOC112053777 [Bicyclus anynana]
MVRIILTFVFLTFVSAKAKDQKGFLTALEEKLENKLVSYGYDFAKWIENVNDRRLGNSELGKMLNYQEMKPKFNKIGKSRGMKKLSMVLLPIIFHVGAASTWFLLTALMATKSVAIGILLLVFKIAVSSAKVASFFTAWKHKHLHSEHSWSPHFEHGHRRMIDAGTHSLPYLSYNPDWNTEYNTLSTSFVPEPYHGSNFKDSIEKKS